ncbi:hypothetical protein FXV77_17375 [Sphingobacterium phlebotomi]|uniref:Uncharacterized protein n=1 Tax=Sphingobacterium phlebotomi TaxID=2605433 RepID=A0A5D4GYH1_9SPHI|nr:hypothetical protein [Sphingobacterium phlebotomi]TYR33636.1 hypothetical protein FXV77_17375 [Sphingobacterium phlebotomi]
MDITNDTAYMSDDLVHVYFSLAVISRSPLYYTNGQKYITFSLSVNTHDLLLKHNGALLMYNSKSTLTIKYAFIYRKRRF